jgi:hypothetical protein
MISKRLCPSYNLNSKLALLLGGKYWARHSNVEDAVGSISTYRREYAKPALAQIQVVPIRIDRVVVGEPRQTSVAEVAIVCGRELGVAVG